jgi:uncharacterized protein
LDAVIAPALLLVPFTVFAGAFTQRVTGLGFALLSSPFLVLLIGPYQGIVVTNLLALITSTTVLVTSRRHIDVPRARLLVPAGVLGVLPGVWVAGVLAPAPLETVIGLMALAGLGSTLISRGSRLGLSPAVSAAAGVTSGFMTATAGVGGPALTAYALATEWSQPLFAATVQISFATQGALSVALKGVHRLPGLPLSAALVAAVAVGLVVGHLARGRIPVRHAQLATILIALAGALATTVRGVWTW